MNFPFQKADLPYLALVLAIQLLLVLPFLDQAIHMDDSIYLDIGRNALKKPLQPHDFPYCFEGYCAPDMASHSHPPLIGYWIGLILAIAGDGPRVHIALHLGFVAFPLLFAVSMYLLARRFSRTPLMMSLLAICSPVAVVMSHNLMSDYPTMALWTAGITLFVLGVDSLKPAWIWTAALPLTLAAFASYPALLAALICWLYAFLKRCRLRAAICAPALPFLWMAGWLSYTSLYFGRYVLSGTARYFVQSKAAWDVSGLIDKTLAMPVLLVATISAPLLLIVSAAGWLRGRVAAIWILAAAAVTQIWIADYPLGGKVLFVILFTAGGLVVFALGSRLPSLSAAVLSPEEKQDSLFLWIWLGAVAVCALLVYAAASARYLLPLLPPFVLLAYGQQNHPETERRGWPVQLSLAFSVLLALIFSISDFEMARIHRQLAAEAGRVFKGWTSQVRIGGEWGFRHYVLEEGFRQFISTSNDMVGGQFILLPSEAIPYPLPQDVESMSVPIAHKSWSSWFPIRIMNRSAHAGFYSSGWGLLPFSISDVPVEQLTVLQVSPLVEELPETELQSPSGEPAIPVRSPGRGVDLHVPLPSRMSIPYGNALPALVQFQWVQPIDDPKGAPRPEVPPERIIRVWYQGLERQRPAPVAVMGAWKQQAGMKIGVLQFRLEKAGAGRILLELGDWDAVSESKKAIIRDWKVLPDGWIP